MRSTIMADGDQRRDDPRPDRDADPSAVREAARQFDRQQRRYHRRIAFFKCIEGEYRAAEAGSALFRVLGIRDEAERVGDVVAMVEIDQRVAAVKDDRRRARRKLRRLRGRLRQLRIGGRPGRPWDRGPAPGANP
jgi:hypothetical protein